MADFCGALQVLNGLAALSRGYPHGGRVIPALYDDAASRIKAREFNWQKADEPVQDEAGNPAQGKTYRLNNQSVPARPLEPALYLVATPIGNLGDITLRALEVLAGADVLACEDTRVTRVLLDRFGITTKPYAYHEHNANEVGPKLIAALCAGRSLALVSDAGTPLVSDPGYRLGQEAIAAGLKVIPIPGASAPLAALVGSGLPNDAFLFAGFLPQKDKARRDRMAEFRRLAATLIFFESPHRIAATLAAAADVFGPDRPAAVCRELTKAYEEFARGTLADLARDFSERNVKGEIVLVVGPAEAGAESEGLDIDALLLSHAKEMPVAKAAGEVAKLSGKPRKVLYQRLLELKDQDGTA